jgi:2,3,4,5-tetrahydropyridine-2-carboxylate N-succinyltransferase
MENVKEIIEKAWDDTSLRSTPETIQAIEYVVEQVDKGQLRTAQPNEDGSWTVNDWVKKLS